MCTRWLHRAATAALLVLLLGCGGQKSATAPVQGGSGSSAKSPLTQSPPIKSRGDTTQKTTPTTSSGNLGKTEPLTNTEPKPKRFPAGSSSRTLADDLQAALDEEESLRGQRPQLAPPRKLDDERLLAAGLRKLAGKHLTLYTDLPSKPAIDELPAIWDLAYPQWCEFFRVDKEQKPVWQMRGFLISKGNRRKFQDLDVIPPQVPDFLAGYSLNYEFFMYDQGSDYYRRHLMLHEGTHGFMWTMLGECTSPWYAEGTAELLGTHRWTDGKLALGHFPGSREETTDHGRIKLVKEMLAQVRALDLDFIVKSPLTLHRPGVEERTLKEGYAWCWATSTFLDGHSRYKDRFRLLCSKMRSAGAVPGQFRLWYEPDWLDLMEEWQVFVASVEYGYDAARNEIAFARGEPLPADGRTVAVRADRSWQSARITLEAGKSYELSATGRVTLAQGPPAWESEADGVTVRYHGGLPLGALLAAVRVEKEVRDKLSEKEAEALQASPFLRPIVVGRATQIRPRFTGTLYLKVNDSSGELADNTGELRVRVAGGPSKE